MKHFAKYISLRMQIILLYLAISHDGIVFAYYYTPYQKELGKRGKNRFDEKVPV